MQLIAEHPDVDAVIYLGLGIQHNQGRMMEQGRFYPDHGLERIVAYHARQDRRFAEAAAEISDATGKPILCATELATADPLNAGTDGDQGDGPALLRVRQSSRGRARSPLALSVVAPPPPRLTGPSGPIAATAAGRRAPPTLSHLADRPL